MLHLSTYMFPFYFRVLQCLACYWGWSCQFVLVGSILLLLLLLSLALQPSKGYDLVSFLYHTRRATVGTTPLDE
jgi:hypothetical protein